MRTAAPWQEPNLVEAAISIACDVRDLDLADIIRTMTDMPPQDLAELTVVIAAMVDVDQPTSALFRWRRDDFTGERTTVTSHCLRGHPRTDRNTRWEGTHRRCRVCDRQRKRAERPA